MEAGRQAPVRHTRAVAATRSDLIDTSSDVPQSRARCLEQSETRRTTRGALAFELSDIKYSTLLLPGLGIHLGDGARVRVSVAARAVYSVLTVSGSATSQKGEVALDGRGVHGWGALASVEMCRDIIGERRGLCAFVQGTQAYSEGLQHAFSGGLRLVF